MWVWDGPHLFYPLLIIPSEKRVCFQLNFLHMMKYIYPKGIFETQRGMDVEDRTRVCSNAYYYGYIGEIVGLLIWVLLFLCFKQYVYALSILFIGITLVSLAYTQTSSFEGLMIMRKQISDGAFPLYLANQAILYTNNYIEEYGKISEIVCNDNQFREQQKIETVKHMYMIKAVNPKLVIDETIQDKAENEYLLTRMDEFRDIYIGEEKYNLLKQYMYTAMILNDKGMQNLSVMNLQVMEDDYSAHNSLIDSPFSFYLAIGKNHIIKEAKLKICRDKLIRENSYYAKFKNYQNVCSSIISEINQLCNAKEVGE